MQKSQELQVPKYPALGICSWMLSHRVRGVQDRGTEQVLKIIFYFSKQTCVRWNLAWHLNKAGCWQCSCYWISILLSPFPMMLWIENTTLCTLNSSLSFRERGEHTAVCSLVGKLAQWMWADSSFYEKLDPKQDTKNEGKLPLKVDPEALIVSFIQWHWVRALSVRSYFSLAQESCQKSGRLWKGFLCPTLPSPAWGWAAPGGCK